MRDAPALQTHERVARFGNPRIVQIYENMPLEDFQTEYEALFVEESTAVFSWDEIKEMQAAGAGQTCIMAGGRGTDLGRIFDAITAAKLAIRKGEIENVLAAGMDVGRTRDTTEIYVVGQATTGQLPLRLGLTVDNGEFEDQKAILRTLLTQLPIARLLIDKTGLGFNLAEDMERAFPSKAQGVVFTGPSKQLWVTDGKMLCQQRKVSIPDDRDLAYQLHSLKRIVTASKQLVFDSDRAEKHHADRAWAWLLALAAARVEVAPVAMARGRTVTAKGLGLE
jgi:phage FluMu gp28-like protein